MGMMPERPTIPTVGFRPTIPFTEEGHTTDPFVSVPIAPAQKFADTEAPDPEEDPHGLRSTAKAFPHCPPRPLQPELDRDALIFAHSDKLAFARIIAPAPRSFAATWLSFAAT